MENEITVYTFDATYSISHNEDVIKIANYGHYDEGLEFSATLEPHEVRELIKALEETLAKVENSTVGDNND